MKRLKVLMAAYACRPNVGSEPGVGWTFARGMAEHHDVWVLTRSQHRATIESVDPAQLPPGLRFVYHDLPHWARFWKKGGRGVQTYYYLWHRTARRLVRRLHREHQFDLAHHVTFGRYWSPSVINALPVPTMWGPLGGGESMPAAMRRELGGRDRLYERLRDMARAVGERDPAVRSLAKRCSLALANTQETADRLRHLGARDVRIWPQVLLEQRQLDRFAALGPPPTAPPVRFISIGRLLHWKGFHLGLEAFARVCHDHPQSEYWLVNDGPARASMQAFAQRAGIAERVRFWGRQATLDDVYAKLAQCHVLVHPALHEAFGNVVLEAMAAGRATICLDRGGPATLVRDGSGFRAAGEDRETIITNLTTAMRMVLESPALVTQLGARAREIAEREYLAAPRMRELAQLYREMMER